MKYGYIRVSTQDQKLDRQIETLKRYNLDHIFQDKISGSTMNRPELRKLLSKIKKDDLLMVSSLDRLSRNSQHLSEILIEIEMKKAKLIALDVPNFEEVDNLNTQTFLHAIILELRKYMAAEERERILERQRQGIAIAKKKGVYKGRPQLYGTGVKNLDRQRTYFKVQEMLLAERPIREIMREANCSNSLIYRIKNDMNK